MTEPTVELSTSALVAAPDLLGAILHSIDVAIAITEVEAYEGTHDPASHAWKGRTARNAVMFGPAGHLYTYTMHGHVCCNVVCSPAGSASAVLVRAGRVIEGIDIARERRPGVRDEWLARGPGCLTKALGITMVDAGVDLFCESSRIQLAPGAAVARIASGPRVGVSRAADVPWRFWIDGDPTVSAYKKSPNAP